MARVPLLAGSGVAVLNVPDDAVVLRPPPPGQVVADVAAAVREALRFPLEGPPLEELVRGASRVTIVVELPSLPIPGAPTDPRHAAVEGASAELERAGVPSGQQTLLVACGLGRRAGPADMSLLAAPEFRRRFRGRVVVHDVEDPELVDLGAAGNVPLRVNRALVDTDAVVVVTAAETVVHGGPAALIAAAGPEAIRAAGAWSLLETAASQGWQVATALERALAARVPLIGVSLVLNHPQLVASSLRGFPYDEHVAERIAGSPLRRALAVVPGPLRARMIRSLRRDLTAAGVFAGPPAVAHAEALLRAIAAREVVLEEPLDAIVVGIPPTTLHLPRELPNPLERRAARPRRRAEALARLVPGRRGRDGDPRSPAPPALPPPHAAALSHVLRRDALRPRARGAPRRRAGGLARIPARSPRTAKAAPATPCSRSRTGRRASPRSSASARCSSRAAATRWRHANSVSSRSTA